MGQGRTAVVAAVVMGGWLVGCAQPHAAKTAPVPAPPAVTAPSAMTLDDARALRADRAKYDAALEALSKSTDETTRRRAIALHALSLVDQKRFAEALPLLDAAAGANPAVAPFLRLRTIDAAIATNDLARAVSVASELVALGETSAATVARLRLPALYAQQGDRAATDAAFAQAMLIPIDELTEGDFVAVATALAKADRADLATTLRMRLLNDYAQGRYTEQTYGFLHANIAQLAPADQLALAGKLARSDHYDEALELYDRNPGAPEARGARMRALFNSRHYTQLLDETASVDLADPALILLRARAAWRAGRPQEFLAGIAQLEKDFPASRELLDAKVQRAKFFITDQVDYTHAIDDLSSVIAAGAPGTDGENIWNLGWTYLLAGKSDDALRTFDRYIAQYPDGDWKTNSLFWSAKLYDRAGDTARRDAKAAQIVAEYPFSYYSYRVKELWPSVRNTPAASTNAFPDVAAQLATVNEPRFTTVDELLELDLARSAAREMKLLAAKYEDNPAVAFLLADVYVRGGEPFKANGVLQRRFRNFVRHGGTNIPQRFWEILYPLPYFDAIRAEAEKRGLDPYLIASLIRQETGFEPSTVSNAGAVGLMQIMPAEAPQIASAAGITENIKREQLFDPATNIAIGAAEYAQKLARMRNNPILAIAAYNAGEQAVGAWLESTPADDIDRFVEAIPYAETRLYVKTVSRNRFEYRRIYEASHGTGAASPAAQ
jgi:soluble lytic murein transglycosylase